MDDVCMHKTAALTLLPLKQPKKKKFKKMRGVQVHSDKSWTAYMQTQCSS